MKKKKIFDCVEMKHTGAEKIKEKTKGMTRTQELKFWEEQSKKLQEKKKKLVAKEESERQS